MPTKMIMERKRPERYRAEDYIAMLIVTVLALLLGTCVATPAHAEPIPEGLAVKAVYNEALHDTKSLDAMCHALRNRASLQGVYGIRVSRPIPMKERLKTLKTWQKSLSTPDVTKGATHWLSDYDLKHCKPSRMAWRFKMKETYYDKTGQTHYYKEV